MARSPSRIRTVGPSMKKKPILVADLLCGAGGSSTGCEQALEELGLDMELADFGPRNPSRPTLNVWAFLA